MKELDPDWPVFEFVGDHDRFELIYELVPNTDSQGREYEMVTQALADTDFYQGLNMVTVIRRLSDGKLFGYFWFDDISKHGESYVESNGEDFGLKGYDDSGDFDWDNEYVSYYVFEPVEPFDIQGYRSKS